MVHSLADITSNGTKQALSASSIRAAWVQIQSKTGNNAAGARIGDSAISSTQGALLAAGNTLLLYPMGNANAYDLSNLYQLATNGDVFEVIYFTD